MWCSLSYMCVFVFLMCLCWLFLVVCVPVLRGCVCVFYVCVCACLTCVCACLTCVCVCACLTSVCVPVLRVCACLTCVCIPLFPHLSHPPPVLNPPSDQGELIYKQVKTNDEAELTCLNPFTFHPSHDPSCSSWGGRRNKQSDT